MNIMFLTQDGSFVRKVVSERVPHAGIVWLPVGRSGEELAAAVSFACGVIGSFLDAGGVRGMRGVVVRVSDDGIHTIHKGREELALSTAALEFSVDDYERKGVL